MTIESKKATESLDGSASIVCLPFIHILFQRGSTQEVGVNGCRIEDVIEVLQEKLQDHQGRILACDENAAALTHLSLARDALVLRRQRRGEQGVLDSKKSHDSKDRE